MFDFVRSHNRLLQVLLGILIVPSFVIFGVQSYTSMNSEQSASVAEVDGHDITRADWDTQHRQMVERLRAQRPNVDPKTLDTAASKRETLDALVRDRVMQAAVAHENLAVSDDRVTAVLKTNPQFEQFRALDAEQRKMVLAQQGLTPDGFFERIRDELAKAQALQGLSASGIVPATATKAALDALMEQRDIQWQHFDTKDYAAKIQPTDAQVQAWYADKAHAAQFTAPEEAQIEYVVLDANALKAQITPDPKVVQAFYENNKSRYSVAEERRASHILINVDAKAAPAVEAKAKAQAEALLAEVRKNPASFADVARKNSQDAGTAAQGGDLDYMGRDTIKGAFGDTLFSMKPGEISNVVRSPSGFHIIMMTGQRGGAVQTFDAVRPQIEDQLRTQEAQKLFATDAEQFTNTVYEQPDSLQPAITAFKLQKQTATVHRIAAPDATGPLASPRLLASIFSNETLRNKHNTEAVETASSQLVSARVLSYQPERLRPLAEVKDQVVAAVRQSQAAAAARKDGEAKLAALRKDPALALPATATVGRLNVPIDMPRPVIEASLKADVTKGPAVTGIDLPDGGYAAIRVVKAVPRAASAPEADQARSQIEQAFEEAESSAVYDALKTRYKVKINEERVAQANAGAASAPQ